MGCGASKNDVIKTVVSKDSKNGDAMNGGQNHTQSKESVNSESSTIPASDMYSTQNGNNNEQLKDISHGGLPPLKPPRSIRPGFDLNSSENGTRKPTENPIAFEVPADTDGSLIKKHPPRRIRQLVESSTEEPGITHQSLEEKVQLANERRNKVLTQRVASARQKSARNGRTRHTFDSSQFNENEYDGTIETG